MSQIQLVVREPGRDWSGNVHGACGDRAIAALSADPTTLEELATAVARFAKPPANGRPFANLSLGLRDEPHDAGLVVIDLAARMVVVDSTYSSPGVTGNVGYHDGRCCTETELPYHLADDWLFATDGSSWRPVAEHRRRERAAKQAQDDRVLLYGKPLLEFVGRETLAAFTRRDASATAVKQIHAAWLLTPRDDLRGDCPRDVLLAQRDHLMWDMQDRCEQWSLLGECPPGLAESSHAYRFGGFGTHELVMYYHLVRELLWSCWDRLTELGQSPGARHRPESLMPGDFLTDEVPRLERLAESWLDTPDPEHHGRTPRSIILGERARLPEGMSGHEAMVDPDCPCCQMLADLPGPAFWHLDGSGMDDEFAFDIYHRTREEWDEEQRRYEEFNKQFNAKWAERESLGVTSSAPGEDGSNAVWSRSYSIGADADVPLGIRVFGIGCHLAELIVGLRNGADRESTPPEAQSRIDRLNRDFGNLRELLQNSDASLAEALIDPVLDRFAETLGDVATSRADLATQCDSLADQLQTLLNPASADFPGDFGASDVPF